MQNVASGYVQQDTRRTEGDSQPFDRIAYAMRALRILRPRGLTVAVREGRWELRVEQGKAWGGGKDERWAVVSIPPDASREAIAVTIAELSGLHDSSLALAVLMTGIEST